MPVYNETPTLAKSVARALAGKCPLEKEVVLVNDCSSDGSGELAEELARKDSRIRVFHHEVNQGKGAGIRTAIKHLRGRYAIIQDADLEYDPDEYAILLESILAGEAEVVYGSRFLKQFDGWKYQPHRGKGLVSSVVANRFLTGFSNLLAGTKLTDMETCYKVIPVRIIRQLELRSGRFGIEPEITAQLAKLKVNIHEVPISYFPRAYGEGKKINWKDGLAAIWHIFRFNVLD